MGTNAHTVTGAIILVGYGSIGKGLLPLLEAHLNFKATQLTVIDPVIDTRHEHSLLEKGYAVIKKAITEDNHRELLSSLIHKSERSLLINLATEVSSKSLILLSHECNALYIDTVVEPWPGFYQIHNLSLAEQTNYALRESLNEIRALKCDGTATAVSCCGANPGMVSWLVKEALIKLATKRELSYTTPTNQTEWSALMQQLGVRGIHIAERDTQRTQTPFSEDTFINTWSVDGLIAEALQPAELGWGTHEKALPKDGHEHTIGKKSAIYLENRGVDTTIATWVPSFGPIRAHLVTHNEAISLAEYFSCYQDETLVFRPTVHYAYHPTDETVRALSKLKTEGVGVFNKHQVLAAEEVTEGYDELGVLLYGDTFGALWYGSHLTIEEARTLAPAQNATGLQVSSAVIAGILWSLENPTKGLVEAEEMDHSFCLDIQKPYLGEIIEAYTDWKPETIEDEDPWQFSNFRAMAQKVNY